MKFKNYEEFYSHWEGCIVCACDHGCNQFLAENAGKMLKLANALGLGATPRELDNIVKIDCKEIYVEFHKKALDEARKRRDDEV